MFQQLTLHLCNDKRKWGTTYPTIITVYSSSRHFGYHAALDETTHPPSLGPDNNY